MRRVHLRYGRVLWLAVTLSTALCFCGLIWSDVHFMSKTHLQYRHYWAAQSSSDSDRTPEASGPAERLRVNARREPAASTTMTTTTNASTTCTRGLRSSSAQSRWRVTRRLRKPRELELLELQTALDSIAPPRRGDGAPGSGRTLAQMAPFEKENMSAADDGTAWGRFALAIGEWALYSPAEQPTVLAELLESMRSARVVRVQTPEWGTQIKFFVDLADGTQVCAATDGSVDH